MHVKRRVINSNISNPRTLFECKWFYEQLVQKRLLCKAYCEGIREGDDDDMDGKGRILLWSWRAKEKVNAKESLEMLEGK